MNRLAALFLILAFVSGCARVHADAPTPPDVQPYKLPTFSGESVDYHTVPALDAPDPRLDFDSVFTAVVACYPMPSNFRLDIEARAVANTAEILNLDDTTQGKYYLQIVAKMPLYSSSEVDRVTQMESNVREKASKDVQEFFEVLGQLRRAHRSLGLYSSLESRSQARVQTGLADTAEQVGYLDKVIESQAQVTKFEASADGLRLRLSAYCRESSRDTISDYLAEVQRRLGPTPAPATVNVNSGEQR